MLELEIEELGAGLRPGTPDNLPVIGAGRAALVWATGHYRNGILLADVTAEAVVSVLAGDGLPEWAAACDPARFAEVRRVKVLVNGEPTELETRRDGRGRAGVARAAATAASRWPSTPRSSRAASGPRTS